MIRASILIATLFVGLSLVPTAAFAQEFRNVESLRALFSTGYCAVRNDAEDARKLFATPPGTKEEAKLLRTLVGQVCGFVVYGGPALDPDRQLMRGVIAEALLDSARGKKKLADSTLTPFANLSADAIAAMDAKGQASVVGLDFAQCIVAASPDGVKAVLKSNPEWDEQDKAFEQLQPYFAPCLPNGAQMTFSKLALRGLLAEASYRSLYFKTLAGKN